MPLLSSNASHSRTKSKTSGPSTWLSRSKSNAAGLIGRSKIGSPANDISSSTAEAQEGDLGREEKNPAEVEQISKAIGLEHPPSKVPLGAVQDDWPLYSCRPSDYTIGEPIGFGSSSVVYKATYSPGGPAEPISCALKVVDVDKLSRVGDIDRLRQETQLMALSKHPNVLRVRGEWIEGSKLFIACRYMSPGSLLDISRYGWPDGFDEAVIATALKQALQGLHYLHINGWLHRDVKAANLLVDDDGTVLLADFGVSSSLFLDENAAPLEERLTSRKSFVGTPAWMAPELAARKPYDSKADIWSFGITALELSQGHAPNNLFPAAKILSKTILDAPPQLDRTGNKFKYSSAMQDMVEKCLCKDPNKRPSAEKLLQHPFFKLAKRNSHLVSTILKDLPPLEQRQERRRKPSLLGNDTTTSWDFNATVPRSPGLNDDPFASFSSNPSPASSLALRKRERSAHRRTISFDQDSPVPTPRSSTFAGHLRRASMEQSIVEEPKATNPAESEKAITPPSV